MRSTARLLEKSPPFSYVQYYLVFIMRYVSQNDLTYVISIFNCFNILPYSHLSLQSTQSQALLDTFSGPLIIVITLLRVPIYYKMPLERTEQCWILYLNFGCNIIQQYRVSHLVHLSSHIF